MQLMALDDKIRLDCSDNLFLPGGKLISRIFDLSLSEMEPTMTEDSRIQNKLIRHFVSIFEILG